MLPVTWRMKIEPTKCRVARDNIKLIIIYHTSQGDLAHFPFLPLYCVRSYEEAVK
jgi:hypothetical protein